MNASEQVLALAEAAEQQLAGVDARAEIATVRLEGYSERLA
ncbi:MAG TPA: hypothetical protein VKQ30_18825 [Ktedonobacterales bacterium]|jgi:hypothetical protein|nr:hypothetical protein [Ktedonobacterales bacterium]